MNKQTKLILAIVAALAAYFGYTKFFPSCNESSCAKDSTVVVAKDTTAVKDSAKTAVVDTTKK